MVVIYVSVFLKTSVVLVSGFVDLMISLGKEINVVCTFNFVVNSTLYDSLAPFHF